eukprot:CAMPEP_0116929638 /NCGR_PEP_ID=MMETSP0467-20121206/26696_1 /TAXON_ID=283647 /ORGANISM="Mesodinium pulex, Strain SPMC105" /LENGTH=42 /DNA_ID= /DNA_START= /DNA_END= /DNA_ORIENTATION=
MQVQLSTIKFEYQPIQHKVTDSDYPINYTLINKLMNDKTLKK